MLQIWLFGGKHFELPEPHKLCTKKWETQKKLVANTAFKSYNIKLGYVIYSIDRFS